MKIPEGQDLHEWATDSRRVQAQDSPWSDLIAVIAAFILGFVLGGMR